jgi:hypothetical protein
MSSKAVLLIIVAIVVAIFAFYLGGFKAPSVNAPGTSTTAPVPTGAGFPPATAQNSTPDAIVSTLLEQNSQDAVTPVESDPSLTAANDQIVNDFDQSFDTSQF